MFLNLACRYTGIYYFHFIVVLVDPGWNDPPMLNYNASNPPPKSRIANKRVAFPLTGTSATKSQTMSSLSTSPLTSIPPFVVNSSTIVNSGQILNPVPDSLGEPLNLNVSDIAKELSNFIKNEQNRKVFLNLWQDDKFSSSCIELMKLLCENLKKRDVENVIKIKETLLGDYNDLCDAWIKSIEI